MSSLEILKSIETDLSRARNIAEHADEGFLLYLIDMAILEVKGKARSGGGGGRGSIKRLRLPQRANGD